MNHTKIVVVKVTVVPPQSIRYTPKEWWNTTICIKCIRKENHQNIGGEKRKRGKRALHPNGAAFLISGVKRC